MATIITGRGTQVVIPEITDYEVRRELFRLNKTRGLVNLNELQDTLVYLPITTLAMRFAAEFWSQARQGGYPTADDKALDADVILAGQALTLSTIFGAPDPSVVVATTNVRHLSRFATAKVWEDIQAE